MDKNNQNLKAGSPEAMAKGYDISAGTLSNLRWKGEGPKFYKIGKKVLYRVEDFERWLFANPVMTIEAHEYKF